MKKFKLIKTYPDCYLKIGEEVVFPDNVTSIDIFFEDYTYTYTLDQCIEFPEFWEEVIDKEFEVITLSYENRLYYLSTEFSGSLYNNQVKYIDEDNVGFLVLSQCNVYPEQTINSIKRLSDNQIFSIGDKVLTDFSVDGVQVIKEFTLEDDKLHIKLGKENSVVFISYRKLDKLRVAEVILTTDDGVDLYHGDRYYSVSDTLAIDECITNEKTWYVMNVKRFSTLSKAEHYVYEVLADKNKPKVIFRTEDGVDITDNSTEVWLVTREHLTWFNDTYKLSSIWSMDHYYIFSSREAQQEFLLNNRPLLTLKEVDDLLFKWDVPMNGVYSALKNLAYSKFNGK